jgi:hypothetical protein
MTTDKEGREERYRLLLSFLPFWVSYLTDKREGKEEGIGSPGLG